MALAPDFGRGIASYFQRKILSVQICVATERLNCLVQNGMRLAGILLISRNALGGRVIFLRSLPWRRARGGLGKRSEAMRAPCDVICNAAQVDDWGIGHQARTASS